MNHSRNHSIISLLLAGGVALLSTQVFANDDNLASHFKAMDSDNDGRISRAEFTTAKSRASAKMDANSDGTVSADEKSAAKTEKKHWWNRTAADKTDKSTMNSDGTVSSTDTAAAAMFDRLDTNQDGYLSESELAAHDMNQEKKNQ